MAVYWVKLYVYDETAASFIGACSYRLANCDYTANNILNWTQTIKGQSGRSVSAWTLQEIEEMAEFYGAAYQQFIVPDSISAGATYNPKASDVFYKISQYAPSLETAYCPALVLGRRYRFCVSSTDYNDNFFLVDPPANAAFGLYTQEYKLNGVTKTLPSEFQLGFSWQAASPSTDYGAKGVLSCLSSDNYLCCVNVWTDVGKRNLAYAFMEPSVASGFTSLLELAESGRTDPDPYAPGGYSGAGGGGGTFDLESDIIGLPPLPTLSFAATGFTRIYNPTLSQLNALANYLWTDHTFLDTVINHLKQLLENPMDAVISLSLLPCSIPNGTPEAVKVMYINTGVSMAPATTQFVDVDCGTYTIEEFYGSALDYNPYTKVHCYLPYIGQVTLDTDEVMGRTLNVVYRIDIVTGMCAAMILVDQNVLYQFSGHCAINMPINSADFSGYIGAAMTAGKMVAGVVAGAAGATALAAELVGAPSPHSSTTETTEKTTARNPATGRQITTGTTTRTSVRNTPGASFGELSRKAVANTVGSVMGSKLTVEHAGGFTGNSGYLAVRRPYVIIERPRMCNPEEYGKYNGRPSMIYMSLGDCTGYTEVQSIQFDSIPATNPELAELSELLKSGVLL